MPILDAPDTTDQLTAPWVDGGVGDGPFAPPPPDPTLPPPPPQPYASSAAGAAFPPNVEQWRTKAQQYFLPQDVNKALYVIQNESGGVPDVKNKGSDATGLFQIMRNLYPNVDASNPDAAFQWAADRVYNVNHGWQDWGEGTHYNGENFGSLGSPNPYGPGGTGRPMGGPAGTNFGLPFSQPSDSTGSALPVDATKYGAIARAMSIIDGRANPESSADPGLLDSPAIYPLSPQQAAEQAQTQDDITKAHDSYQHLVDTGAMTADQAQAAYEAVIKQLTAEKGPNVLQQLFQLAASIAANRLPGGDKTPRTTFGAAGTDIMSSVNRALGIGPGVETNGPANLPSIDPGAASRITASFEAAREATKIPLVTPAIEDYVKPFVAQAIDHAASTGISLLIPGFDLLESLTGIHVPSVGKPIADQIPSTGADFALLAAGDLAEGGAGTKALVGGVRGAAAAGTEAAVTAAGRAVENIGGETAARVGSSATMDRILPPDILSTERTGANIVEASGGSRLEGARAAQAARDAAAAGPKAPEEIRPPNGPMPTTREPAQLNPSQRPGVGGGAPESSEGPPVKSFTTSQGSSYEVQADGTTVRDKAARPEHPGDEGIKPRSDKTVYVSRQGAQALAIPQNASWRLIDNGDGTVSLATRATDTDRWGIAPSQRNIPVSETPSVGAHPLELWKPEQVQGHSGYAEMHPGNAISQINGAEPSGPQISLNPNLTTPVAKLPAASRFDINPHGWLTPDGQLYHINDNGADHSMALNLDGQPAPTFSGSNYEVTSARASKAMQAAFDEGWIRVGQLGNEHYIEANLSDPRVATRVRSYMAEAGKRGDNVILEDSSGKIVNAFGGSFKDWVDAGMPMRHPGLRGGAPTAEEEAAATRTLGPSPLDTKGVLPPPTTAVHSGVDRFFKAAQEGQGKVNPAMSRDELATVFQGSAPGNRGKLRAYRNGAPPISLDEMRYSIQRGRAGQNWYRTFGKWLDRETGGRLGQVLLNFGVTSAQSSPASNLFKTFKVLKAWNDLSEGGTKEVSFKDFSKLVGGGTTGGLERNQVKKLYEAFTTGATGTGDAAAKTPSYARNLLDAAMGQYSPFVTADTHHAAFFNFQVHKGIAYDLRSAGGAASAEEYAFMERVTQHLAAEEGITPMEAQAAMWETIKKVKEADGGKWAKLFNEGKITWGEAVDMSQGHVATGGFEEAFATKANVQQAYRDLLASWSKYPPPPTELDYQYRGPGTKTSPASDLRVNAELANSQTANVVSRSPAVRVQVSDPDVLGATGLERGRNGLYQFAPLTDAGIMHHVELGASSGAEAGLSGDISVVLHGASEEKAAFVAAHLITKWRNMGLEVPTMIIENPNAQGGLATRTLEKTDRTPFTPAEIERLDEVAWRHGLSVRSVTGRDLEHISLEARHDPAALGNARRVLRDAKIDASVYDSLESAKLFGGGDASSILTSLSPKYDHGGVLADNRANTQLLGTEDAARAAPGVAGPHPEIGRQPSPRGVPLQDERFGDFPNAAGGAPESVEPPGGSLASRSDDELAGAIERADAARVEPSVKGPLDTAVDKFLEAARREANLRRSGTVDREIRQGRTQQFQQIRESASGENMDFGVRQDMARDAARVGTLRRTFIEPIELSAEELNAVGNALGDMLNAGEIHGGEYMQMLAGDQRRGRPSIIENMTISLPNLQPHEVALIRRVWGEEVAAGQELRVRAAKSIEPSDAQVRAETEKLNANAQVTADKAYRQAYIKAHKALELRDEKAFRQAERELKIANEKARGAAYRQYMDSEKEMDDAWKAAHKEWDRMRTAERDAYLAGEDKALRESHAARMKALKAFDDADQLEQRVTRRYIEEAEARNARAALGRDVEARLGQAYTRTVDGVSTTYRRPLTALTETDVNWPRTRQEQAQSTYGKDWANLTNEEKLQIATDHGSPEDQLSALQAVHQEHIDSLAPNYTQLYQKLTETFMRYDKDLERFAPTYAPEDRPAAELAARVIQHQLAGNRAFIEKMTPEGGFARAAYLARAVFTGDLKDAYLNILQRRIDALEMGLRMAGMQPELARGVARLLRDADIAERYGAASGVNIERRYHWPDSGQPIPMTFTEYDVGSMVPGHTTEVPESVTKALAEMKAAPIGDTFYGLDKAAARWKNTVFAIDGGVLGVHMKAAIDRGGITGIAGLVNRTLAALSLPHADLYSAEVNLPRMIRDVLDGGHAGNFGSAVTDHQGTMLTYLTDYLERSGLPQAQALDHATTHLIEMANDKLFGNIMGWIRDVNFEGNLAVLKALGRDTEDPIVRYTAMQYAQATSSMADTALNSGRRGFERKVFTSSPMMRGEVANLLQMAKFFRPDATAEERILAATLIGSRMISTLVIGAAIAAVIGVGTYEMNPTKKGFGQITTRWKDGQGRHIVLSIFPQESLVKAFIQATDVLAEKQDVGTAAADILRAFVGRSSLPAQVVAASVGTGYDDEGRFHMGDLNKGENTLQQVEGVVKRGTLSPLFSSIANQPNLVYDILQGVGQAGFPESTSHLRNREAEAQYIYDPTAEGGQRLRQPGEQGEGVPYTKLLPSYQLAVNNSDTVKKSADTFTPTDYKAAFNSEKQKYDQMEQDDLQHWHEGTLSESMPKHWNDLSMQRQASGGALQTAFAKELGGIPVSRVETITQKYYSDDYLVKNEGGDGIDFDATAAKRQGYIDGLSTKRDGNQPSDHEIMVDWLKRVEGAKTEEHKQYDTYIATKKALGFFDPQITPQQKTLLERAHPEIEADDWKWNGGVVPAPGKPDTNPTAHSAAAVNLELGLTGDFPHRLVKMATMERPVNENQGTVDAWKQYGQRASDFIQGYPNDAEFNARRAARQGGEALHLYQKPYDQLSDKEKLNVQSNLTSSIKTEVLRDSPDLGAYLAWSGAERTIYPNARPALDSLRNRFGMEPFFKDGEPIRLR